MHGGHLKVFLKGRNSQRKMAQREQAVVGVFDVEIVVVPGAMETAFGRPEAVDKIEQRIFQFLERHLQAIERMKRHRRGEQIRHRRAGEGEETAAFQLKTTEEPVGRFFGDRLPKISAQSDRGGCRGNVFNREKGIVGPASVFAFQAGETGGDAIGVGDFQPMIRIGAVGEEAGVGGAGFEIGGLVVAAVGGSKGLDGVEDCGLPMVDFGLRNCG